MRLASVMVSVVLAGCGRVGFTTVGDATADDATDASSDARPDEVLVTVVTHDAFANPLAGADVVVVQDNGDTALFKTDANGQVHAPAHDLVTIHVAVMDGPQWPLTTYEEVPAGTAIRVGPSAIISDLPQTAVTLATYASAAEYGFSAAFHCALDGAGSTAAMLSVSFGYCQTAPRPILFRAYDGSGMTVAAQIAASVDAGTSVTLPDQWMSPQDRTVQVDALPAGYTPFSATLLHAVGGDYVPLGLAQGSVTATTAAAPSYPASIDAVQLFASTSDLLGLIKISRTIPSAEPTAVVPVSLTPRTIDTLVLMDGGAIWTLSAPGPAAFVQVVDNERLLDGTLIVHQYYLPPERTSYKTYVWPAALANLNDIDTALPPGLYVDVFDVDGETYSHIIPSVDRRFGVPSGTGLELDYSESGRSANAGR